MINGRFIGLHIGKDIAQIARDFSSPREGTCSGIIGDLFGLGFAYSEASLVEYDENVRSSKFYEIVGFWGGEYRGEVEMLWPGRNENLPASPWVSERRFILQKLEAYPEFQSFSSRIQTVEACICFVYDHSRATSHRFFLFFFFFDKLTSIT